MPHIFLTGDVIGFTGPATISSEQGRLAACYALEVRPDLWRAIGRSRGATSVTTTAVCWICSVIEKTTALRPCNRAQVAAAPPFHLSCDGIVQDRAMKFRKPLFFHFRKSSISSNLSGLLDRLQNAG